MLLSIDLIKAIQAHALAEYPNEAVGFVYQDRYEPKQNIASLPAEQFELANEDYPIDQTGLIGMVHSHTNGNAEPTVADMEGQMDAAMPWGVFTCDGETCSQILWWGDELTPPPLLGRQFRSGPSGSDGKGDCYALIRDYFRLERGVMIDEFPRDDLWWTDKQHAGDMYTENFKKAGFTEIHQRDLEAGDVILMRIRSLGDGPNHGAVYLGRGLIMQHMMRKLSVREPIEPYMNYVTHYLRYVGEPTDEQA